MRDSIKWIVCVIFFFLVNNASAIVKVKSTEWLKYNQACDMQWTNDQKGHHRHVGKAVCACLADALIAFQTTHPDSKPSKDDDDFYKQASQICTTSGVLANSVERAVFDRMYDEPTIQTLCKSSWVGLMGSFQPADITFNSSKVCQCAGPGLTRIVANFDDLSPKELRLRALALVKTCDPSAKLTNSQFSALNELVKAQATQPITAKGRFYLEIKEDANPDFNDIANYLRKDGRLAEIVAALNQTIKIPYDIKIATQTTGQGSYYVSKDKTIYLDYQMMSIVPKLFDKFHANESAENRHHYINNVNRFLLYHELGHALIDAYHLPVLGQEEDGADALSAVISMTYLPKGFQVLVDSADFFLAFDKLAGTQASLYWDEHSLNKQRYYRLLCFAYGNDPKNVEQKIKYYYGSGLNEFIKDRSDYCHDEFNTTYSAWMGLLKPYLNTTHAAFSQSKSDGLVNKLPLEGSSPVAQGSSD